MSETDRLIYELANWRDLGGFASTETLTSPLECLLTIKDDWQSLRGIAKQASLAHQLGCATVSNIWAECSCAKERAEDYLEGLNG